MTTASNFQIESVQAVAFTPKSDDFRTAPVLAHILPGFADRYDGDIESQNPSATINLIAGVNQNIRLLPHVTLTSEDKHWKFDAQAARTESVWNASEQSSSETLREICKQCYEPLLEYLVPTNRQVGRLALVVHRWVQEVDPAIVLSNRYCKAEMIDEQNENAPFRHSIKFEIHNLKTYQSDINELMVNSWVRSRSGTHVNGRPAVTIEHDINTLHEKSETSAFSDTEIREFFDWASLESEKVLNLYYPESS